MKHRTPSPFYWPTIIALLALAVLFAPAHAQDKDTADIGNEFTLYNSAGKVRVLGKIEPGDVEGGKVTLGKPGPDVEYTIKSEPTTKPAPRYDVLIKVTDDLSDAYGRVKEGTADRPTIVALAANGRWPETLKVTKSNVHFVGLGVAANRSDYPRITAATGLLFKKDDVRNVTFTSIDFYGKGDTGTESCGIYGLAKRCIKLHWIDCGFYDFRGIYSFQNLNMEGPLGDFHRDHRFIRTRGIDCWGKGLKAGHGFFVSNVDGFLHEDSAIIGAGLAKLQAGKADVYTQGFYFRQGCRNPIVRNPFLAHIESVGIQARGPLYDSRRNTDDGKDVGPLVEGGVIIDAGEALIMNGPRANLIGTHFLAGHYYRSAVYGDHGQRLVSWHVGKGKIEDTIRVSLASGAIGPKTGDRYSMIAVEPRKRDEDDDRWARDRDVSASQSNNVDAIGKRVEAVDVIKRVRAGGDIAAAVAEVRARVLKAIAGSN